MKLRFKTKWEKNKGPLKDLWGPPVEKLWFREPREVLLRLGIEYKTNANNDKCGVLLTLSYNLRYKNVSTMTMILSLMHLVGAINIEYENIKF